MVKLQVILSFIVICFLMTSCSEGSVHQNEVDQSYPVAEDTLLAKALWYIYSLNSSEYSSKVNIVDAEGKLIREKIPIVTVSVDLGSREKKGDTTVFTFNFRERMDPSGSYNALYYRISFIDGKAFSTKSDDGWTGDIREYDPNANDLFISELKVNRDSLIPQLLHEAQSKNIIQ